MLTANPILDANFINNFHTQEGCNGIRDDRSLHLDNIFRAATLSFAQGYYLQIVLHTYRRGKFQQQRHRVRSTGEDEDARSFLVHIHEHL